MKPCRARKSRRYSKLSVRERQYKHIVESLMDKGKPQWLAERIASATVNKTRARFARTGRGPRLIKRGGSRRQWYPGKGRVFGHKGRWRCLEHHKSFKTKAGLNRHLKAHKRLRSKSKRRAHGGRYKR